MKLISFSAPFLTSDSFVSCKDDLCFGVVQSCGNGLGGKARENDGVDST